MKKINKRTKIKWGNLLLLAILLFCSYVVLHDIYMITIHSWITSTLTSWTWYGLITFALAIAIGGQLIEYFSEEFNK